MTDSRINAFHTGELPDEAYMSEAFNGYGSLGLTTSQALWSGNLDATSHVPAGSSWHADSANDAFSSHVRRIRAFA